jgi:hypothetical protein
VDGEAAADAGTAPHREPAAAEDEPRGNGTKPSGGLRKALAKMREETEPASEAALTPGRRGCPPPMRLG